jgi:zinc D-Ala-D-Ala carboxypeptidase
MTHYANWRHVPKEAWRWKSFSPREIACKGTGSILVNEDALDRLQKLRDTLGVPVILVSAYRSPEHNRRVGGATRSKHMEGVAFDVNMTNHNPAEFERAARAVGFTGFGYYPRSGFMHIDTGAARVWGTPFPVTDTNLPPENPMPKDRDTPVKSTTVQASATQIAAGAGTAVAGVSALDGTAQIVVMALAGVIILAGLWIMRERLRKWAAGDH